MNRKLFVKSVGGAMAGAAGASALTPEEVAAEALQDMDRAITVRPGDVLWVNLDRDAHWSTEDAAERFVDLVSERTGIPRDRIITTRGVSSIDVVRNES